MVDFPRRLYSVEETMEILGFTCRLVFFRRVHSGKIACVRDGRFISFLQEHIEEYLERHTRPAAQPQEKGRRLGGAGGGASRARTPRLNGPRKPGPQKPRAGSAEQRKLSDEVRRRLNLTD